MIDLGPAAERMAALLGNIDGDEFAAPTPCPNARLGDLIDHVGSLSGAFTEVAHKRPGEAPPGPPDAANLADDWQQEVNRRLETLVAAWRDPTAWEGMGQDVLMSENLKLLGAYSEAMASGDEEAVFAFFAPEFTSHVTARVNPDAVGTDIRGEELRWWSEARSAFPDMAFTVDLL